MLACVLQYNTNLNAAGDEHGVGVGGCLCVCVCVCVYGCVCVWGGYVSV